MNWPASLSALTRNISYTYVPGLHPPPKKRTEGLLMKFLQKNKIKNSNLNTELAEMGVFSAVAGNQLPNQLQEKSPTGSLPPAVPVATTPTFSPWTRTSDDSYIYQLSLVLATATVSYIYMGLLPSSSEVASPRNTPLRVHGLSHNFLLGNHRTRAYSRSDCHRGWIPS